MLLRRRSLLLVSLALGACKGSEAFVATPTSIRLSSNAVNFRALGATQQLSASVLDQRGDPIQGAVVVWSTDNAAVASIDGSGLVTSAAVGSTKVRATMSLTKSTIVDSAAVTVTQIAAQLVKVLGDLQVDTVGTTLPTRILLQVDDSLGHPVPGITVSFAVTQGGGSLTGAADTTDVNGLASVAWTLGGSPAANVLSASVGGSVTGSPASFSATGVLAGTLPTIARLAGGGQPGLAGAPVNVPPAVIVLDAGGQPIAGATVTFAIPVGGGAISGAATVTDANGVATVGSWSLPLGTGVLTASVSGLGAVIGNPVSFVATGVNASYHIDVRFITTMTPTQQAAFTNAAAKWESVIFGDVPDIQVTIPPNACLTGQPGMNEIVDDVVIFAAIDSIDGPGKILGQAGPCFVRTFKHLPVVGIMQFDSADVATLIAGGSFGLVIQHEMGHVLGYGTIWQADGLLANPSGCDTTQDPHFTGSQALAAFDRIGGINYVASAKVPVENHGGAGTCDGHWRESVFKNELMTGFLNIGSNPLSLETVASMGDLGYFVTYSASDPYFLSLMFLAGPAPSVVMRNDIMQLPIKVLDPAGRVVGTLPPRR